MATKGQHVVPNSRGGWSVRETGAQRASKAFSSEAEAVEFARDKARRSRGDLYVHARDGTVRERNSYSPSASPRR